MPNIEREDMANPNLTMPKLKRAFQLLAANVPQRTICEQLHMGRGVLSKYKKAADEMKLSYEDAGRLNNEELESFLQSVKSAPCGVSAQRKLLDELIPDYVSDLAHNRYLTVQRLHEKYLENHPDGYGYTQFKKGKHPIKYTIPNITKAAIPIVGYAAFAIYSHSFINYDLYQ